MTDHTMDNAGQSKTRSLGARQLGLLMSYRGRDRLRAMLGVDDPTLDGLLADNVKWPEAAWDRFEAALGNLSRLGHPIEVGDLTPEDDDAEEPEMDPGDATEVAEETDDGVWDVAGTHASNGSGDGPEDADVTAGDIRAPQQGYELLWKVRDLGISHYLRRGVPYHKQLAALRVVIAMEMALIFKWRELPTKPGVQCDEARLSLEFDIRNRHQTVIGNVLEEMYGGFKGPIAWVLRKGRVNVKKLEDALFAEAGKMDTGYTPSPLICLIDPDDFAHTHRLVRTYFSWHRLEP